MANKKISELTELDEAPAPGDLLVVVDVSDTSEADSGTTKKVSVANLAGAVGGSFPLYVGFTMDNLAATSEIAGKGWWGEAWSQVFTKRIRLVGFGMQNDGSPSSGVADIRVKVNGVTVYTATGAVTAEAGGSTFLPASPVVLEPGDVLTMTAHVTTTFVGAAYSDTYVSLQVLEGES